jgi:hypothetical protein
MASADERVEIVCRTANEAIEASRRRLGVAGLIPYLCECDSRHCHELVRLTSSEYTRARAASLRFVVAHGHTVHGSAIVEQGEGFVLADTHPAASGSRWGST